MVPKMVGERVVTCAACVVAGFGLIACGSDKESTAETSPSNAAVAAEAEHDAGKKPDRNSNSAREDATGNSAKPEGAKPPASMDGRSESESSDHGHGSGGQAPRGLSDEERCERKPASCGPKDTHPDYSNPDVRRAEKRAEEPDQPTQCDSADCERLRSEEG